MIIHGRVLDEDGLDVGHVTIAGAGRGRRVLPDALGHFSLSVRSDARTVHIVVERDGVPALERTLVVADLAGELVLELPPRGRPQGDASGHASWPGGGPSPADDLARRLAERAVPLGLDPRSIEATGRLALELDDLAHDAVPALSGDADALARLRAAFELEAPFDFDLGMRQLKPYPGDYGLDPCALVPRSPWALIQVGMTLDGESGHEWAGRAVTAILRRSEPLTRVQRALTGLEAGQVTGDVLAEAITFAAQVADGGSTPDPIRETLGGDRWEPRRGPAPMMPGARAFGVGSGLPPGFPPPPVPGGAGAFPRRPSLETLLDPCNLEWLECAHTFVTNPPATTPAPPAIGKIDPTDIAAGHASQITLSPPLGSVFPATQHTGWTIALQGVAVSVSSWDPSEIVLDVPAATPACRRLFWLVDQYESAEFFNLQADACARFFGGRRPPVKPIVPVAIGQISVVGTPAIGHFTANGVAPKLLTEGCTAVQLDWQVDPLLCAGSSATLAVEVRDDSGAVLWQGSQRTGVLSVTEQRDRTYTVTATNTLNGVQAGTASTSLEVERYQRLVSLAKIAPVGVVRTGAQVTIEATLSCPADDPVQVAISSDRPDRCPGLTIAIPVGQTKATGQVNAGTNTGRVTLSGRVVGVSQSAVEADFAVNDPKLDALVGSSLEQCDGGTVTVRVKGATSVASVILNGPGGSIPARGALQATASVPNDPASGTIQAVASFGALAAGSYAVQVVADGVTINAGNVTVALGAVTASLAASPTIVQVCALSSVTLSATARRATELSITRSDGSVLGTPVSGTNPCGTLTATATAVVSGKATFRAVAKRQGSATVTSDVTVGETTTVPTAPKVYVRNAESGTTVLYIYVDSLKPGMAVSTITKLGQISPGQQIAYTPAQCEVFQLWGLLTDDPSLIGTTNFRWTSGLILGHPIGTTTTFDA